MLGEFGELERLVLQRQIPLGYVFRALMNAAFNLRRLHADTVEITDVFEAIGAMAACEGIADPTAFAEQFAAATRVFCEQWLDALPPNSTNTDAPRQRAS